MPSAPLLAALAVRAINEQQAARSRRGRPRRITARLGQLTSRQGPKAPVEGEERLGRPHPQGPRRRDLAT